MVEGLQHLVELQRLDDDFASVEGEHSGLPARRSEIDEKRTAAEAALAGAREALQEGEQEQRRKETAAQDREAHLGKLESQQTQVKTNEAYTTLLREMEACRAEISDCETGILEAMEVIESARNTLAAAEEDVSTTTAQLEQDARTLDAREKELAARIESLGKERAAVRETLPVATLRAYERVGARRRPAIALDLNELCTGCRVKIPPQVHIDLQRGETMQTCQNCHRILILASADALPTDS